MTDDKRIASLIVRMTNNIERAKGMKTWRVQDGIYMVASRSQPIMHEVCAVQFGDELRKIIVCTCPDGTYSKDDFGDSLCAHAIALAKRLLKEKAI
jgi:hypothetical protein